jgi:DnaK suppressor protein
MTATPQTTTTRSGARRPRQAREHDLRAMLHDRQREMLDVLQHRVRHLPTDRTFGGLDETEQAEADIQEHIEVALIQMKGETLQRIREALVRLDAGEYGDCAECGGEISKQRLQVLPFAVRCTACEESQEQQAARARRFASPQGFSLIFTGNAGG